MGKLKVGPALALFAIALFFGGLMASNLYLLAAGAILGLTIALGIVRSA